MTTRITLNEGHFRRLIAGESVELDGIGEVILADIGHARMHELIGQAAGWSLYEPDIEHFITVSRTPNGAWLAGCVDHDWSTRGPIRFVGETLGVHLQEEHPFLRVEDFADIFVAALYGLCGHSWDPAGQGIPEPTRENRS